MEENICLNSINTSDNLHSIRFVRQGYQHGNLFVMFFHYSLGPNTWNARNRQNTCSHLATPIDTESNLPNRTQQVLFNYRFVEIHQCMYSDKDWIICFSKSRWPRIGCSKPSPIRVFSRRGRNKIANFQNIWILQI